MRLVGVTLQGQRLFRTDEIFSGTKLQERSQVGPSDLWKPSGYPTGSDPASSCWLAPWVWPEPFPFRLVRFQSSSSTWSASIPLILSFNKHPGGSSLTLRWHIPSCCIPQRTIKHVPYLLTFPASGETSETLASQQFTPVLLHPFGTYPRHVYTVYMFKWTPYAATTQFSPIAWDSDNSLCRTSKWTWHVVIQRQPLASLQVLHNQDVWNFLEG